MSDLQSIWQANLLDNRDTAFLYFDLDRLGQRLRTLAEAFPPATQHAVAIKTNPQKEVLRFILAQGFSLEAASAEELQLARAAGAPGNRLVFDSPVKTREEIEWCVRELPGLILNANSLPELERLPWDGPLRLGLRINPLVSAAPDRLYDVSQGQSKFGVAISEREAILAAFRNFPLQGLHLHVGSGAPDTLRHRQALEAVVDLARAIEANRRAEGRPGLHFLDIGGGLSPDLSPGELADYGAFVDQSRDQSPWELWTEFGQWVHHPVGKAFSRIEYCHPPRGDQPGQVFLHLGADLFTRQVYHRSREMEFEIFDASGLPRKGKPGKYQVVGPLCFAGDVLANAVDLPGPQAGDWVAINQVGANTYGLWSRHCSRSIPKIIGQEEGQFRILQTRQSIAY